MTTINIKQFTDEIQEIAKHLRKTHPGIPIMADVLLGHDIDGKPGVILNIQGVSHQDPLLEEIMKAHLARYKFKLLVGNFENAIFFAPTNAVLFEA